MASALDDLLARVASLPAKEREDIAKQVVAATAAMDWLPNLGPQTEAYFSPADLLLYGGQGGGGKSSLLLGLALTAHQRSLIMRRQYTDLGALTEEAVKFNGTRDGFNGSPPPKLRTRHDRLIEFGAARGAGDEQHWQGQPHDLLGFDEAVQFLESQVRFLMGWVRSTDESQRCRTVMASNPPTTAEGQWIVGMFRPWLDITHPHPARHGELRWYVTDPDGNDLEVPDRTPIDLGGKTLIPKSRTFIPAQLKDNPYLVKTGYQATLDALPEPVRSAVRDGNFMAARADAANQIIPTAWVIAAQDRWRNQPTPPRGVPMCAMGVDVAQGGDDNTTIAARYDGWYAPIVTVPGKQTPLGSDVAGIVVANRRNGATVIIDMGGGYGGGAYLCLKDNGVEIEGYKGAEGSTRRTRDGKLGFVNKRSEAYWRFREALDPDQEGGSPIFLPDDPALLSDLTAPTFEVVPRGVKAEPKEALVKRLGRSPDRGDAVVMAWFGGVTIANMAGGKWPKGQRPQVILGHKAQRRRR